MEIAPEHRPGGEPAAAQSNTSSVNAVSALKAGRAIGLAILFLFFLALLRRGWMCDDAFVTLRAVDNLVNWRGFVFNVGERVQGFTNPLWALLVAVPYMVTREPFVTTVLCAVVTSLAYGALLVFGVATDRKAGALVLTLLCFSKAFIDFSTSGLENPLSHLLLLSLCWAYLRKNQSLLQVSFFAALCWVNRFDSIALFAPILAAAFFSERPSWARVRAVLKGQWPAIAWFSFAIIYYGFPFPNTAYAKLNTNIPKLEVLAQGVTYLLEAVYNDPISAILMLFALALGASATRERGRIRVLLCSVIVGTLYVVSVGGDFMAGRFLTPILTLCSVILVRVGSEWAEDLDIFRWAAACSALIILSVPFSPLRDEPSRERMEIPSHGIANERAWYMFLDQVGLMMNLRQKNWQGNGRFQDGKSARDRKEKVAIAGNIGMFGFGAGPRVHVLDPLALTEPLLARMPYAYDPNWRTGHLGRPIPEGYMESLRNDSNAIVDPCLHDYYDKLRVIVRGPIFSLARFKAIWALNLPSGATAQSCQKKASQ